MNGMKQINITPKTRVTIGITTYNRLDIVKAMADSFYRSSRDYPYAVRIYDDASSEFSIDALKDVFPDAVSIIRHERNMRADANTYFMYKDFLHNSEEILFNADSDLIFNESWLQQGLSYFTRTDGVLSLFNTLSHRSIKEENGLCEKMNIGAAGTLMSRRNVDLLFKYNSELDNSKDFDWNFCNIFRELGIKIYTVKNSLVQHIGFTGQNTYFAKGDYGVGFSITSIKDGQTLNDVLAMAREQSTSTIRGNYSLFPFELVPKGSRVVIYGAGRAGNDYMQQLKKSNYAILVGVVDIKPMPEKGISAIRELDGMDFDYLVLATKNRDIADDMLKCLQNEFGNKYEKNIIDKIDESGVPL